MANEAIIRDRLQDPIGMACGNTNAIEKGAILSLIDPRVASGAFVEAANCAGIAAREKISGDGRTTVSVFQNGIFDVVASGSITIGSDVQMAGAANIVEAALSGTSGRGIIGQALEAASDGETFQMRLNL